MYLRDPVSGEAASNDSGVFKSYYSRKMRARWRSLILFAIIISLPSLADVDFGNSGYE